MTPVEDRCRPPTDFTQPACAGTESRKDATPW